MNKYNGMKYARDWVGKEVVLTREVDTRAARHPAGLRGKVTSQQAGGLTFEAELCACCGVRPRITRLGYFDVMLALDRHANAVPDQCTNLGASAKEAL